MIEEAWVSEVHVMPLDFKPELPTTTGKEE